MHDCDDSTPRKYRDYLDLCCEMLSDENAALRFELRETQADRDTYRKLSQVSIAALTKVTHERDQARRQLCVMREIQRDMHGHNLSDAGAAA